MADDEEAGGEGEEVEQGPDPQFKPLIHLDEVEVRGVGLELGSGFRLVEVVGEANSECSTRPRRRSGGGKRAAGLAGAGLP